MSDFIFRLIDSERREPPGCPRCHSLLHRGRCEDCGQEWGEQRADDWLYVSAGEEDQWEDDYEARHYR